MSRTAVELLVKEIRARKTEIRPTREPHVLADFELIRRQSDAAPRRRPSSRET
jgi:LacI family transcriptional regulator